MDQMRRVSGDMIIASDEREAGQPEVLGLRPWRNPHLAVAIP
jgi:hypothetical protein